MWGHDASENGDGGGVAVEMLYYNNFDCLKSLFDVNPIMKDFWVRSGY